MNILSPQKRLVILKFLLLVFHFNQIKSEVIGLYDNQKDDIEILDVNNFNQENLKDLNQNVKYVN